MDLPKSLKEKLAQQQARDEQRRQRKEEAARKAQEKAAEFRAQDAARYPEKLGLSTSIFEWVVEFKKTSESISLIADSINGLTLYGGGWGHTVPTDTSFGCCSRVLLDKQGTLAYEQGYKYFGRDTRRFSAPAEMAQHLNHSYLENLLAHLETGEVFKRIELDLERRLKNGY